MNDQASRPKPTAQETGRTLLKRRSFRRNLLFGSTLLTLVLVFVGAVPLNRVLAESIVSFACFWIVVLLLVGFILLLALYDMIRIRVEHRERLQDLEKELADAAEEARQISEETQALLEEELKRQGEESSET
ncbi:MAG: hypothetical protein P1U85_04065 [Verrucomicrobiales bacterium]|nr:hypothetical protein [Verrucomicrobiales bacterium]